MTTVSVVVTCYQQERYIVEALDSVAAQTWSDYELVVTDDASTDASVALIESWADEHDVPVDLVVNDANLGINRVLNIALARCRGRYLAYLGGDDVWAPRKLACLVGAMEAQPDAAVGYSDARLVDADGALLAPSHMEHHGHLPAPEGRIFFDLLCRNFVIASSAVYRRRAITDVGGWDPDLPFEDWDMLLRLADRHPFVHVPEVLVDYRLHDESLTRKRFSHMLEGRMSILEKWLDRDPDHDAVILPYLREQSWRLYKVYPERGRRHVAVAHRDSRDVRGRLRRLVATNRVAEAAFEVLRRVRRVALRLVGRPV